MSKGIDPKGVNVPPDLFVIKGYGAKVHVRNSHGWSSYCGKVWAPDMWRTKQDITCRVCAKAVADMDDRDDHRPLVPWGETMNTDTTTCVICGQLWKDCCEDRRYDRAGQCRATTRTRQNQGQRCRSHATTNGLCGRHQDLAPFMADLIDAIATDLDRDAAERLAWDTVLPFVASRARFSVIVV